MSSKLRLSAILLLGTIASAQTYPGQIGVEIEHPAEASRSRMFVDLGKVFRPCTGTGGSGLAPIDANGWPASDAQCVIFDARPVAAWANSIDDPARFQLDMSGTYKMAFTGQATVQTSDPAAIVVSNKTWDPETNTTSANVTIAPGTGLVVLTFTDTRRTPGSAANTGFTNLKFLRPGYPLDTTQVFTPEFLRSLHPFSTLRFMGFLETNGRDPAYPGQTHWSDRHVPSDATQQPYGNKHGVAWEYLVMLANAVEKDIWINIPASADDDYVLQLATLLKSTLKPSIRIYIEHSNEVWNPGADFSQSQYNQAAAAAEVAAGNSPLATGTLDTRDWGRRRHAKRLIEIGKIFKSVYGPDSLNDRIRLIYAWWTIYPNQYQSVLNWVNTTYGPPSQFFYALAQTHYFNADRPASPSVPSILAAMRDNSDSGNQTTAALHAVAQTFGLRHVIYEGGPDNGGGSTDNVGNRILANRDPGMKDLLRHDIRDNWFAKGGDLYMYFTLSGGYSRYGCWGATEDILDTLTPKFQALHELLGMTAAPAIAENGIVDNASYRTTIGPNSFVAIYGSNFTDHAYTWDATLSRSLGGVTVRIGGKYASIYYASPGQINALVPSDLEPGNLQIEVATTRGSATANVAAALYAPAFYLYQGRAIAQFANTATLVDATHPAAAGDYLQLYASGLGPAADISQIRITLGGIEAKVLWAGLTYPGLFQVNIQVPQGISPGAQPIILTVAGHQAQDAVLEFR